LTQNLRQKNAWDELQIFFVFAFACIQAGIRETQFKNESDFLKKFNDFI